MVLQELKTRGASGCLKSVDLARFSDRIVNDPAYLELVCHYSMMKYGNTPKIDMCCCKAGRTLSELVEDPADTIVFYQDSSNIVYNTKKKVEAPKFVSTISHF
jgi:hypothetical protein